MALSQEDIRASVEKFHAERVPRQSILSVQELVDMKLEASAVELVREAAINVGDVAGFLVDPASPKEKIAAFYYERVWIGVETSLVDLMGRGPFRQAIPYIRQQLDFLALRKQESVLGDPGRMIDISNSLNKARTLLTEAEQS